MSYKIHDMCPVEGCLWSVESKDYEMARHLFVSHISQRHTPDGFTATGFSFELPENPDTDPDVSPAKPKSDNVVDLTAPSPYL